MNQSRTNNFDLVRLIAALQVMFYHALTFFDLNSIWQTRIKDYVSYFPGVPIFFTISGFLIYRSLERNSSDLKRYFKNRFLRIYPALWVCLLFTTSLLFITGQLKFAALRTVSFYEWILAQISVAQFYKLPSMESWGVGHPNGSLWSISVELQYYFLLPILFLAMSRISNTLLYKNLVILFLACISVILNSYQDVFIHENELAGTLMGVSLLHYLYFFCVGILIHLNYAFLEKYISGKGFIWLTIFIFYHLLFKIWLGYFDNVYETNFWGLLGMTLLGILTISFAYTLPNLSTRILNGNDISYGIYIFHMPIINYFYHQQNQISWQKLLFICSLVICVAYLSWRFIESRMLRFKA